MNEPNRATDYHDRGVQAVYSVLIEMGQVLGAWRDNFVIVGGAVPWLLLGDAQPQHVGTMDIDIDLDPVALTDGEYANLVEALEKKGYERNGEGLKPFQLRRWVTLGEGDPIAVLVDLLMPRDARGDRKKKKHMKGLRVQRATGGEFALIEHVEKTLEGKMPDGRYNRVNLLVASIPALLVMKGYALVGRDKKKDAYGARACRTAHDRSQGVCARRRPGVLHSFRVCKQSCSRAGGGPSSVCSLPIPWHFFRAWQTPISFSIPSHGIT